MSETYKTLPVKEMFDLDAEKLLNLPDSDKEKVKERMKALIRRNRKARGLKDDGN